MTRRGTKAQRQAEERLIRNLRALQEESVLVYAVRATCPAAWEILEADRDVAEPRVAITIRIEKGVAAFYKAMGRGGQARINRILATWAQRRIAEIAALEAEVAAWEPDPAPDDGALPDEFGTDIRERASRRASAESAPAPAEDGSDAAAQDPSEGDPPESDPSAGPDAGL